MLNIDLGGAKHRRDINGFWKIMDIQKGSEYIYNINSGKKIKLKDNSVDNYYLSMVLEHVDPSLTVFLLNELYRTLKPRGLIRIIVPDAKIGIYYYLNNPKKLKQKGNPSKPKHFPDTNLSRLFAWFYTNDRKDKSGHSNAFDIETLNWYLNKANYKNIKQMKYNDCSQIFINKDYERYRDFSLYVEATK